MTTQRTTTQRVSKRLDDLLPGPDLAAFLAELDPSRVASQDLPRVLLAQYRQGCHSAAQYLRTAGEMARRGSAAGLDSEDLAYAHSLTTEFPLVLDAMELGMIGTTHALVFHRHLCGLPATEIDRICRASLPGVRGLTLAELSDQLAEMVIAVEPERAGEQLELVELAHAEEGGPP